MLKKIIVTILLLCTSFDFTFSQINVENSREDKLLEKANQYFYNYEYKQAYALFSKSVKKDRRQPEIMIKLAQCCSKLNETAEAEEWYTNAINTGAELQSEYILNYATILISNGKFDKAKKWLNTYSANVQSDIRASKYIGTIENINEYYKDSTFYLVENCSTINSSESDISPVVYKDRIFFSSRRKHTVEFNEDAFYDIYYTSYDKGKCGSKIKSVSNTINTINHEGPLAIAPTNGILYYTRNIPDSTDLNKYVLGIFQEFIDSLQNSRGTKIIIDGFNYSIGHPCLNSKGDELYFISDANIGYGGADIYRSRFKNEKWSFPENLGNQINTKGDEMFPFVLNDSILYFSSNGQGGIGGLDIFKVNLNKTNSDVINLGYPINSNADDFGMFINDDERSGYFVSNRSGGYGSDDIYKLNILKVLIKGSLSDAYSREFINEATILIQTENQDDILVKSDSAGNFEFEITVGTPYRLQIKKENYQPQVLLLNKNFEAGINRKTEENLDANAVTEFALDSGTYALQIPNIIKGDIENEKSVLIKKDASWGEKLGFTLGDRLNFNLVPENKEDTSIIIINEHPIKTIKGKSVSFTYDTKINVDSLTKSALKKIPVSTFKDSITAVTYSDVISSILTTSLVNSEFIIVPSQDVDLRYGSEPYVKNNEVEDSTIDLMNLDLMYLEELSSIRIPLILKKGKKYHISSKFKEGRLLDVITSERAKDLIKFSSSKVSGYKGDSLKWLINGKSVVCLSDEKLGFVLRPDSHIAINIIEEIEDSVHVPLSDIQKSLSTVVYNKGDVKKIRDISVKDSKFVIIPKQDVDLRFGIEPYQSDTIEDYNLELLSLDELMKIRIPLTLFKGKKYHISTEFKKGRLLEIISAKDTNELVKFTSGKLLNFKGDSLRWIINGISLTSLQDEKLGFVLQPDSNKDINIVEEIEDTTEVPISDISKKLTTVISNGNVEKIEDVTIINNEFTIIPDKDIVLNYSKISELDSSLTGFNVHDFNEIKNFDKPISLKAGVKYIITTNKEEGKILDSVNVNNKDVLKFCSELSQTLEKDSTTNCFINGKRISFKAYEQFLFGLTNIKTTLFVKEINDNDSLITINTESPGIDLIPDADSLKSASKKIRYRIQIAAARKPLSQNELDKIYKGKNSVKMFREDNYYKYYVDEAPSYFEAKQIMEDSHLKEGFIVAYIDGTEKTTLQNAMKVQYKELMEHKDDVIEDSIISIVTVNFAFDDYRLKADDVKYIQDLVVFNIIENCDYYVVVNGHTDVKGSDAYNLGLSEERAEFVKNQIIKMGIPDERIRTYSYGESMLLKTCKFNEECGDEVNRVNRRVEIIVFKPKN